MFEKTSGNAASANTSEVASGVGKLHGHSTRVVEDEEKESSRHASTQEVETHNDNHIWMHITPLIY